MAHDHVYGICENKCFVEVLPKTQAANKNDFYTKNVIGENRIWLYKNVTINFATNETEKIAYLATYNSSSHPERENCHLVEGFVTRSVRIDQYNTTNYITPIGSVSDNGVIYSIYIERETSPAGTSDNYVLKATRQSSGSTLNLNLRADFCISKKPVSVEA